LGLLVWLIIEIARTYVAGARCELLVLAFEGLFGFGLTIAQFRSEQNAAFGEERGYLGLNAMGAYFVDPRWYRYW